MCRDLRVHISRDVTDVMLNVELCWCAQGKISSSTVLSNLYAMGVTECDNMLMHVGVSQKMSDKERDAVLPLLATGFKVPELNQLVITCLHHQYHEQNRLVGTRDVNFVFFQKSIIVLKKSIFFRLSNLGVAISLSRGLLCNAPSATQY